jgi:hypothetical protein
VGSSKKRVFEPFPKGFGEYFVNRKLEVILENEETRVQVII